MNEQRSNSPHWLEKVLYQLMCHLGPQDFSLDHRMVIVETCIDARVFYFSDQVMGAVEVMLSVGDQTIHGEVQIGRAKLVRQNDRDRACDAAVRSRIFRVGGRSSQGRPQRIARQCGITASRSN